MSSKIISLNQKVIIKILATVILQVNMLHPYPEGDLLTCINSKLVADFNTRLVIISWSKL